MFYVSASPPCDSVITLMTIDVFAGDADAAGVGVESHLSAAGSKVDALAVAAR